MEEQRKEIDDAITSYGKPPMAVLNSALSTMTNVTAVHCTHTTPKDMERFIDNGGTGLGFVAKPDQLDQLQLAHEAVNRTLCSHFIDPIQTTFQGLDWVVMWQALQSPTWIKAVVDRAQLGELQRFGVPGVVHLPMAAINRRYDLNPLDPAKAKNIVSFVGGQNTSFYSPNVNVQASQLLAGVLGHAVRGGEGRHVRDPGFDGKRFVLLAQALGDELLEDPAAVLDMAAADHEDERLTTARRDLR